MNRTLLIAGLFFGGSALFFSGCATPAQSSAMVAAPLLGNVHAATGSLSIAVSGGRETSSTRTPQISNEEFGTALAASIEKAGLFSGVSVGSAGRYQLNAYVSRLTQPLMGFSMTVTMEVAYALVDNGNHQIIWQKSIVSEHTAAASEAFVGVKRLRLATEGTAKANIESLLRELMRLDLK